VGGVPASDALKTIVSDGLMLVGDAARHTDPPTGGGMLQALSSGHTAGEVARKAVRQNDASARVLREYETEWNNHPFGKQHNHMYKAKQFLVERSDEELNRMARAVYGIQPEEMTLKGIMMRILKKDPKLMLMIRHLL
jgi:digeranylgeranylglycerophospholipid reductase